MTSPQVEALLASEDYGKDLASVNNLLKKHQLLEADISAHEVRCWFCWAEVRFIRRESDEQRTGCRKCLA